MDAWEYEIYFSCWTRYLTPELQKMFKLGLRAKFQVSNIPQNNVNYGILKLQNISQLCHSKSASYFYFLLTSIEH